MATIANPPLELGLLITSSKVLKLPILAFKVFLPFVLNPS
jgi:hypothetical protein